MKQRNFFKVALILSSITCILSGCSKSNVNIDGLFTKPTSAPMPTIIIQYVESDVTPTPAETPNETVDSVPDNTEIPVPSEQPIVIDTQTQTIGEDSYGYYYDQLTKEQKVIYCSIFSYQEKIQKGFIEFTGVQLEDFMRAKEAVNCDQFFLGVRCYEYGEKNNSIIVRVPSFEKNLSEKQKKKLEKKADKILDGITEVEDEAIIRGIYNWCTKHIKYDKTKAKKHTRDVYGALIEQECVCVGYAEAFKYLSDKAGIECIYVESETHAWNYVQLDGQWYAVDATWGEAGTNQYLLEGKEFMENKDHISENLNHFTLPTLAENSAYPTDSKVQQIKSNLQDDIVAIATERLEGLEEEDEYDEGEYQLLYSINQKAKEILEKIDKSKFHYYINTSEFSTDYNELETLIKVVNEI